MKSLKIAMWIIIALVVGFILYKFFAVILYIIILAVFGVTSLIFMI